MEEPTDSLPLAERASPERDASPADPSAVVASAAPVGACTVRVTGTRLEIEVHTSADIANAEALHAELAGAAAPGRDVSIDLSGVERLDAAGLQLLVAFKGYLEHGGGSLELVASAPVVAALANMGASQTFGLVQVRGDGAS